MHFEPNDCKNKMFFIRHGMNNVQMYSISLWAILSFLHNMQCVFTQLNQCFKMMIVLKCFRYVLTISVQYYQIYRMDSKQTNNKNMNMVGSIKYKQSMLTLRHGFQWRRLLLRSFFLGHVLYAKFCKPQLYPCTK